MKAVQKTSLESAVIEIDSGSRQRLREMLFEASAVNTSIFGTGVRLDGIVVVPKEALGQETTGMCVTHEGVSTIYVSEDRFRLGGYRLYSTVLHEVTHAHIEQNHPQVEAINTSIGEGLATFIGTYFAAEKYHLLDKNTNLAELMMDGLSFREEISTIKRYAKDTDGIHLFNKLFSRDLYVSRLNRSINVDYTPENHRTSTAFVLTSFEAYLHLTSKPSVKKFLSGMSKYPIIGADMIVQVFGANGKTEKVAFTQDNFSLDTYNLEVPILSLRHDIRRVKGEIRAEGLTGLRRNLGHIYSTIEEVTPNLGRILKVEVPTLVGAVMAETAVPAIKEVLTYVGMKSSVVNTVGNVIFYSAYGVGAASALLILYELRRMNEKKGQETQEKKK